MERERLFVSSDDGGASWQDMGTLQEPMRALAGIGNLVVRVDERGSVFRSTDRGQSWSRLDPGTSPSVSSLHVSGGKFLAFSSMLGGSLSSSTDGITWVTESLPSLEGRCEGYVRFSPGTGAWAFANSAGYFVRPHGSESWQQVAGDDDCYNQGRLAVTERALFVAHAETLWSCADDCGRFARVETGSHLQIAALYAVDDVSVLQTEGARVFRMATGSGEWTEIAGARGLVGFGGTQGTWLAFNPYAGAATAVRRSDDLGDTWSPSATGLPGEVTVGVLVAAVDWAAALAGGGLYLSSDQGNTWQLSELELPAGSLVQLASGPEGQLVVSTASSVLLSSDGGTSWSTRERPAPGRLLPGASGSYYLAGESGLFVSADNLRTWEKLHAASSSFVTLVELEQSHLVAFERDDGMDTGRILLSDDGGRTWRASELPAGALPTALTGVDGGVRVATAGAGLWTGSSLARP